MYSALSGPKDWIPRCIKTYLYLFVCDNARIEEREILVGDLSFVIHM